MPHCDSLPICAWPMNKTVHTWGIAQVKSRCCYSRGIGGNFGRDGSSRLGGGRSIVVLLTDGLRRLKRPGADGGVQHGETIAVAIEDKPMVVAVSAESQWSCRSLAVLKAAKIDVIDRASAA